jgi:PilZ domain
MKFSARWLEKLLVPETDRADRRPGGAFAAYYWSDGALRQDGVKDISATGVYIITNERWPIGSMVALTLQNAGPLETSPERRITTRAKVVRSAEDGIGLAFVPANDPESKQWESLVENVVSHAKLNDMLGLVRTAEALKFLGRICSGAAAEVATMVRGLSNHRLANAVDIALKTQDRLASESRSGELHANPRTVVRILEIGSSAEETWLRDFWAGLFVTSCTVGREDDSSLHYVELFSQLTTIPLRILTVVCKAANFHSDSGTVISQPLACNVDEMVAITGARGVQLERDLERLVQLGLIEAEMSGSRTSPETDPATINVIPTPLALELFARCNGHRGAAQDLFAAAPPGILPA